MQALVENTDTPACATAAAQAYWLDAKSNNVSKMPDVRMTHAVRAAKPTQQLPFQDEEEEDKEEEEEE